MDTTRSFRPSDYVLTAVMVALAVAIALANILAGADAALARPLESQSVWMVPVFAAASLPVLWRRRHILAAIGVSFAVVAASVPAFGWVTRCGFALPLSVAMAYAVARFAGTRGNQLLGLVGVLALQVVTLVQDSSTGGLSALSVGVPAAALAYAAGALVQRRSAKLVPAPTLAPVEHVHS